MRPKEMKKYAMGRLSDSWGLAVIVILTIIVIYIAFMLMEMSIYFFLQSNGTIEASDYRLFPDNNGMIIISVARMILGYLVMVPAMMGAKWWYLHAVRGERNSIHSMFVCYMNPQIYLKTVAVKSIIAVMGIVAALPVLFCAYLIYRLLKDFMGGGDSDHTLTVIMAFFAAVLLICLSLLYLLFILKFALVDYIYVLNPDLKILDIIRASNRVMKDRRRPLVELVVSFTGWILLCVLIFPALFVVPYFAMSFTVCINRIIEESRILDRNLLLVREPKPAR